MSFSNAEPVDLLRVIDSATIELFWRALLLCEIIDNHTSSFETRDQVKETIRAFVRSGRLLDKGTTMTRFGKLYSFFAGKPCQVGDGPDVWTEINQAIDTIVAIRLVSAEEEASHKVLMQAAAEPVTKIKVEEITDELKATTTDFDVKACAEYVSKQTQTTQPSADWILDVWDGASKRGDSRTEVENVAAPLLRRYPQDPDAIRLSQVILARQTKGQAKKQRARERRDGFGIEQQEKRIKRAEIGRDEFQDRQA